MCEGNMIGVQYYGEWRTFRIVRMHSLNNELDSSSSPVKYPPHLPHLDQDPPDIIHKLSKLALDDSSMEEQGQSRENADSSDSYPGLEKIPVLKITARSRMIVGDPSKTKPSDKGVSNVTYKVYRARPFLIALTMCGKNTLWSSIHVIRTKKKGLA